MYSKKFLRKSHLSKLEYEELLLSIKNNEKTIVRLSRNPIHRVGKFATSNNFDYPCSKLYLKDENTGNCTTATLSFVQTKNIIKEMDSIQRFPKPVKSIQSASEQVGSIQKTPIDSKNSMSGGEKS